VTNGIKVHTVCFSPDGQILAAANAGDLGLWRMDPLQEVDPLERTSIGPQSGRHWCAFSPDGSTVAYAPATSRDLQIVALADARTGTVRQQIGSFERQTVRTLAFSPDGHWLVLGRRSGDIDLYHKEGEAFEKAETLRGHTADIMSMVFAADGAILATAGFDQTIRLWDTGTWEQTTTLRGHLGPVWDLVFWPRKDQLLSAGYDGQRYVWSTRPSSRVSDAQPHPAGSDMFGMSLDSQGETLCFLHANQTCSLWDPARLSETTRFPLPIAFSNVVASALGPGGRTLALALRDHTIRLWDTAQPNEIGSIDTDGPMSHLRFSCEGRYLAGTGQGSSARYGGQGLWVWRTEAAATQTFASLPDVVLVGWNPLEFTRDERQLVLGFREGAAVRVGLWDFGGSGELHPLEGNHQEVAAVGSSPDGRTVVAVGVDRSAATVTLWDAFTWKRLPVQGRASAYFMSVTFSPDGRRVFTGDLWGDIGVWDVGTGRELMRLEGPGNPFVLRFLGDRNTVFAAGFSGMHVWRAPTFAEIETAERERSLVSAAVWQHE
jgi:WD40 repeat protein